MKIRPETINDFFGQNDNIENLKIYIKAAKNRNEALEHVLLHGAPGLGKTTLAHIIANELESNIKVVTAPSIETFKDLAGILTNLNAGDVLFIDEIHRLNKNIEETLYSVMEDYSLDIVIGQNNLSKSINIDILPFTLIGATTKISSLSAPLRDRFGITITLKLYSLDELKYIIQRSSNVLDIEIDEKSINEIAKRARGTPRIANKLLKRVRDFSQVLNNGIVDYDTCIKALEKQKIDENGLFEEEIRYMDTVFYRFNNRPVGINAIASVINESVSTIEDVYEPFLIQMGFVNRTLRGRQITDKGILYLNNK